MNNDIIITNSYSNPEIEAYIANLDAEIRDFSELQGKEDALKEYELTEPLLTIKVTDHIQSRIQMAIDFVRNILLPTSLIFSAAEIDQAAKKNVQVKNNEINDKLQVRAGFKRRLDAIIIDPLKKRFGKWLTVVAILVGFGDAVIAYTAFRNGSYPIAMAAIMALGLGAVIAVSHLFYAGWIKKAETEFQRIKRIVITLICAFLFFACIGNLRANAANQTVDIGLNGNTVSAVSTSYLNGWAVAFISFGLFTAVFFLSLVFWRTKKERMEEEEYLKLSAEIEKIDTEIKTLQNEILVIEQNASKQKNHARIIFDYATSSIRKCKSIGVNGIIKYKQTYARFHNDIVPSFFEKPMDFQYEESFQFPNHQKTE